ncbi:hypothetical protein M8J75_000669 [Diaphorina citri]|nr:hypothetical protein M8J75_000669 [Diaphorina citri]
MRKKAKQMEKAEEKKNGCVECNVKDEKIPVPHRKKKRKSIPGDKVNSCLRLRNTRRRRNSKAKKKEEEEEKAEKTTKKKKKSRAEREVKKEKEESFL